jgi:1-acyl-sn-glycerol-3-phosphate acyltransferase
LALGNLMKRLQSIVARLLQSAYGVYAILALALVVAPSWITGIVLPTDQNGRRARKVLSFLCRAGLLLAGLKPRVSGKEFLAEAARYAADNRPLVVVSNHASYLDVLVVAAVLPAPICFVAKSEAAAWPLVGTFIRKCRYLTVSRQDALRAATDGLGIANRLQSGEIVHVFPEGTFTPYNGLRPFQLGAFKSALECECPILPVTLCGTRRVLRDGCWMPRFAKIRVVASPVIKTDGNGWPDMIRLRDSARAEILKNCGEGTFDALLAGVPKGGLRGG